MCLISAIMIFLVLQIGNGIYRYSLISSKPNLKSGKIKVYVPVSTLASINLGTEASVRTEGVVKLDNLKVIVNGGSTTDLHILGNLQIEPDEGCDFVYETYNESKVVYVYQ
jgi:hypothetical protein